MDAATVAQLGSGEPTVMHGEADTVQAMKEGARGAAKTRIRTRIAHVGSEYRRDVTSGTCELCIAEGTACIRDITVELTDLDTGATWKTVAPTLPLRPWNDIWEVRVNPFPLAKAPHVALTVARGATPTRTTKPRPRADEAGAQSWRGRSSVTRIGRRRGNGIAARGRYSQATPSLSRSRRGL